MRERQKKWLELEYRVGLRWRSERKKNDKSLDVVCKELAEKGFEISRSGLANFETGKGQPLHVQTLIMLLCWLYKVEPNNLYGDVK